MTAVHNERSICDTCGHRVKHIMFTGLSTVTWDGNYTCGVLSDIILEAKTECSGYEPCSHGQMTLEAFA